MPTATRHLGPAADPRVRHGREAALWGSDAEHPHQEVADTLANLMHYCQAERIPFAKQLRKALRSYEEASRCAA